MTAVATGLPPLGHLPPPGPQQRTVLAWPGRTLHHAEVETAVADLARRLVELEAPAANVLAVGPLCPAYVVTLLACLRVGAVAVPVDAGLAPEQYAAVERTTRPALIVSSDVSTVEQYRGGAVPEVVLDAASGQVILADPARTGRPARYADPDAGYLIPTSGSTGGARTVVGSRRGLHTFLTWFVDEFGLGPDDVCAAATRVNFDPSLRELLAVLAAGQLCLPGVDIQLDPAALGRHLADSRATLAFLVPSLARRVADTLLAGPVRLPHLRYGFFAGEVLPPRVVARWNELAPGAELVNLYGLTEATLAQLYRRGTGPVTDPAAVPVGRPRPGVTVTLAQPDPDGRGEVHISAAAPAVGLLRDGPTAAGVLLVDPFPRPLPTGDIGYWTGNGELMIAGRVGNSLKVAGRRVSYTEFVDGVERIDGVAQCVVVDRDGPHAVLAVHPGVGSEPLRRAVLDLAARLGLPRPTVHLKTELPLLRSGKVDRVALAGSVAPEPVPDRGPAGSTVDILLDRLGLDRTAARLSFVEAGLSSLDVMDLTLEVNRRFGLSLSVQDCFERRDVDTLAAAIDQRDRATPAADPEPAGDPAGPDDEVIPLSTRQLAYQAICMADGNADWCNISRELLFERAVTAAELATATDELLARHDVLRLALTPDWSGLVHTGPAGLHCPITTEDGTGLDPAALRDRIQQARVRAVTELLDPAGAPPVRAVLVSGDGRAAVLLVAHHLFLDGLSLDLVTEELRTLLAGRPLPAIPDGPDFRAYCRATRRSSTPSADAAYWRGFLAGVEPVELPEAAGPTATIGALLSRPFGLAGSRAAHRLALHAGVSVFSVLLAAYQRAVAATFGRTGLAIVVPVQLREGVPSTTAGMFMSQLIVRSPGTATLTDDARALARQLASGAAHSGWEFDQRVGDLGPTGSTAFPFSTVLFNQRPAPRGRRVRDLGAWQPRSLGRGLRYQLQGELQMSGAEIALTYYYRQGIAPDGTMVIDELHARIRAELLTAPGPGHGH